MAETFVTTMAFLVLAAFSVTAQASELAFRGFLQGYPNTDTEVFWNAEYWDKLLKERAQEGFTAVVWYGPNEFTNGQHMLVRHREFPEARELSFDFCSAPTGLKMGFSVPGADKHSLTHWSDGAGQFDLGLCAAPG